MTVLWGSKEICKIVGGPETGSWLANGISINSKAVIPNDIFIALKGPNFDGHDFVFDAFRSGAVACIVEKNRLQINENQETINFVFVEDTTRALTKLAKEARNRVDGQIIAITGSVGKTTTKDILRYTLSRQNITHATFGNYNNQIGVPLCLARMPSDTYYGVFEIGMSTKGEIGPLSCLVQPNIALITSVNAAHLAAFSSIREIAIEKADIFKGLSREGIAIIPADSNYYKELAHGAERYGAQSTLSFGTRKDSDYKLLDTASDSSGSKITVSLKGRRLSYKLRLRGQHMALNSLAALAVVDSIGADVEQASQHLIDMMPTKGRGQKSVIKFMKGYFSIIDESYNASPLSMLTMIRTIDLEPVEKRKILVLGDMLELGTSSRQLHEDLALPIQKSTVTHVFTTGKNMEYLNSVLPSHIQKTHTINSSELATILVKFVRPGDVIAIKGSARSKMSYVVEALSQIQNQLFNLSR